MQVIDGLTMDYTQWTRDYDKDLDDDDDVYLLINENENIEDDNDDENEEANIQKKVVSLRIGELKNNILYRIKKCIILEIQRIPNVALIGPVS